MTDFLVALLCDLAASAAWAVTLWFAFQYPAGSGPHLFFIGQGAYFLLVFALAWHRRQGREGR